MIQRLFSHGYVEHEKRNLIEDLTGGYIDVSPSDPWVWHLTNAGYDLLESGELVSESKERSYINGERNRVRFLAWFGAVGSLLLGIDKFVHFSHLLNPIWTYIQLHLKLK